MEDQGGSPIVQPQTTVQSTPVTEAPSASGGILGKFKALFRRDPTTKHTLTGSGLAEAIDTKPSIDSGTPLSGGLRMESTATTETAPSVDPVTDAPEQAQAPQTNPTEKAA